jgi:hypothetical protein
LIRSRPLAYPYGASRFARIPISVSQTEIVACDGQAGAGGEESVGQLLGCQSRLKNVESRTPICSRGNHRPVGVWGNREGSGAPLPAIGCKRVRKGSIPGSFTRLNSAWFGGSLFLSRFESGSVHGGRQDL